MRKIAFSLFCLSLWFNTIAQPAITPVLLPKYIQGSGTSNPGDERRVPMAHLVEVTGLTANATYRYYNRFTDDPITNNNGFGNYIIANKTGNFNRVTSASLSTPGSYGEFTTDATGKAQLWLVAEPSIDTRFSPGRLLYVRLLLNNGAGGTNVSTRLSIATDAITAINFTNGGNPLAPLGTGLRSTAVPSYNAKDFVMLFDNVAGTGRPEAGTYVESDGVLQRAYNDPNPANEGYAPFYALEVDGKDKTWGTIIPNNLPNGIRNISNYSLQTGALLSATQRADAQYPTIPSGTISTINPTGGLTALVISGTELTLPVKLQSFKAVCNEKPYSVKVEWKTELEVNVAAFEIQESFDGVRFEGIETQKAKGAQQLYELSLSPSAKAKYFRLKMIDKDGKYSYSNVEKVNCNQTSKFSAFPNPASGSISVNHESAGVGASINILSMSGALIQSKNLVKGSVQTKFDLSALIPGNYILLLKNNDKVSNQIQFTKL
jgi:hypothetical protein